jgi:hypothetical protein
MKASGQHHDPVALPPEIEPSFPVVYEAGSAPETVWRLWSTDQSIALAGNQTPTVQPMARRYADRVNTKLNKIRMCSAWCCNLADYFR